MGRFGERKEKHIDTTNMFLPISTPISPFPDLSRYDPWEHYEIPKSFDPVGHANRRKYYLYI